LPGLGTNILGNATLNLSNGSVYEGNTTFTSSGALNISSTSRYFGQMIHSGAGTVSISGELSIDPPLRFTGGGHLNLNNGGLLEITDGLFLENDSMMTVAANGSIDFAGAGTTIDVKSFSRLHFTGAHLFDNLAKLNANSGGDIIGDSYLDIGANGRAGSLTVSGVGSTFQAQGLSDWGADPGGGANVSISDFGVATLASLRAGAVNGGQAKVDLLNRGRLAVGVQLSAGGAGAATFNINGGALNVGSAAQLGGGALVNYTAGTFDVAGALNMTGNARINTTATADKTVRAGSLSMTQTSRIDLTNNRMIVDYTGASPAAGVRALLLRGYDGGDWQGNGLTSSTAAAGTKFALGYAEASDIGSPATFFGLPIDNTAVLVRYTLYGDANLDGTANVNDFARLAANFNRPADWSRGDFNFSGGTDISDFALLAANFNQSISVDVPRGSSVPEPVSVAIATCFIAATTTRRPRRSPESSAPAA
jgi:hypothetical protein